MGEGAIEGDGFRTATVVATLPLQLVALFGLQFGELERQHPELAEKVRLVPAERR
jgi:hypothetical protein